MIAPARNWGVCGYWWPDDERLLFSLGAFCDDTPSNGQSTGDDDNWAFARMMFNYTSGMPDKVGFDPTAAHIFGIRTATFW